MLKYKIDVLSALKSAGYTTYKIKVEKLLSESTVQKLRTQQPISWDNLERLCGMLKCDIGDILYYTEDIKKSPD